MSSPSLSNSIYSRSLSSIDFHMAGARPASAHDSPLFGSAASSTSSSRCASQMPSPRSFSLQDSATSPPEILLHTIVPSSEMTLGYHLAFERCPDVYQNFKKIWQELQTQGEFEADEAMKMKFDDATSSCMIAHNHHEILSLVERFSKLKDFFYLEGRHIFADFFFIKAPLASRIGQNYHLPQALGRATKKLLDDARVFEQTRTFIKTSEQSVHTNGEPAHPTYKNLFLMENPGKFYPTKYVIENIEMLKASKVTTLFIEHFFYDTMQVDLERYMQAPQEAPMPVFLKAYVTHLDAQAGLDLQIGFEALLKLAKAHGIRLVGISTEASAEAGNSHKQTVNGSWHQLALNYQAIRIIQAVEKTEEKAEGRAEGKQGNYAIICKHVSSSEAEGIPTLGTILKCKTVN